MDLIIKSIWEAVEHVPVKDTYAIRIWASWSNDQELKKAHPKSLWYVHNTIKKVAQRLRKS